jgi:hypothetical protein
MKHVEDADHEEMGHFIDVGGVHSFGSIKHERNGKIVGRHCTVLHEPVARATPLPHQDTLKKVEATQPMTRP